MPLPKKSVAEHSIEGPMAALRPSRISYGNATRKCGVLTLPKRTAALLDASAMKAQTAVRWRGIDVTTPSCIHPMSRKAVIWSIRGQNVSPTKPSKVGVTQSVRPHVSISFDDCCCIFATRVAFSPGPDWNCFLLSRSRWRTDLCKSDATHGKYGHRELRGTVDTMPRQRPGSVCPWPHH